MNAIYRELKYLYQMMKMKFVFIRNKLFLNLTKYVLLKVNYVLALMKQKNSS